jgi:hypothetical protein
MQRGIPLASVTTRRGLIAPDSARAGDERTNNANGKTADAFRRGKSIFALSHFEKIAFFH